MVYNDSLWLPRLINKIYWTENLHAKLHLTHFFGYAVLLEFHLEKIEISLPIGPGFRTRLFGLLVDQPWSFFAVKESLVASTNWPLLATYCDVRPLPLPTPLPLLPFVYPSILHNCYGDLNLLLSFLLVIGKSELRWHYKS